MQAITHTHTQEATDLFLLLCVVLYGC